VFVALGIRHKYAWALLSYVRLYCIFPRYLINGTIFEIKNLLIKKYVFWFSLRVLSQTFPILRRPERDVIKIYVSLHVKYQLFLSDFNET
jgi:hypothetical protein